MVKVVFDTVVFVRGLINPRGFAGKLVFEYADQYELILSQPIVEELLEVLQRPELTRKFKTLPRMNLAEVLSLLEQAELVDLLGFPPVSRDPNDDKFLATARAGNAAFVISADKDLLDLRKYEGIRIVNVAAFLRILEEG